MSLADLFPDADYRLRMRVEEGAVADFFGPSAAGETLLVERRRWLESDANSCLALRPEGIVALEETCEVLGRESIPGATPALSNLASATKAFLALGKSCEPDLLLLKRDTAGTFRLYAGCVCFPSSWSLAEKIGQPLASVHEVVPDLNEQLGRAINAFLTKMPPGVAWRRSNWGLSRSPELNQHPARHLRRLDAFVGPDDVWLRVEYQALVSLPKSDGVLFGIRLDIHSLPEVKGDAEAACRLRRALETMPEPMARYKGIADARETIVRLLQ